MRPFKPLTTRSAFSAALLASTLLASCLLAPGAARAEEPSFDLRLTGYAYPHPIETLTLKSQRRELEMAYMHLPAPKKAGGEAGPTAVLLHGKNFNAAAWAETAAWLQGQGYGVLAPDQIGFGKSSKPTAYQYSFEQLAWNTAQLLDHLKIEKAVIIGHSMGGMLGTRFALAYPERVEKLVLVNPIGLEDYLDHTRYPTIDAVYAGQLKTDKARIIGYQKKFYYDGAWNDRYEALTVPLRGLFNGPDREDWAYVSALTTDMVLTQPVIDDLPLIKVPATLIMGTRDRTAPNARAQREGDARELGRYDRLGAEIRAAAPQVEVVELDDLGHSPQVEAFDRFTEALEAALPKR